MTEPKLGKLETLKASSVWPNEAHVFTPWLSRNLALLAEALEFGELTLKETEAFAGAFRIDILAEDEEGAPVIIENQFGRTDHQHLGQIMSYVASLGDKARVIWVAEEIRDEHRAAIDWLNAKTVEGYDFFAVEVRAFRIGSSDPAPFFDVIAKPNAWTRAVGEAAHRSAELADRHLIRRNYWASFGAWLNERKTRFRIRRAPTDHWFTFAIGRGGFSITATLLKDKRRVGVELLISDDPSKQFIRQLMAQKDDIEREFGGPLEWRELPGRKSSRVGVFRQAADILNPDLHPDLHAWMFDAMTRIDKAFARRVRDLRLDETESPEEAEEP